MPTFERAAQRPYRPHNRLCYKGYDSRENRAQLHQKALKDSIMQKAQRGRPLSREQSVRNGRLAKVRHVVEQSLATLRRKFRYARVAYFALNKARAQSRLKAMCVNLLKAATDSMCLLRPERQRIT